MRSIFIVFFFFFFSNQAFADCDTGRNSQRIKCLEDKLKNVQENFERISNKLDEISPIIDGIRLPQGSVIAVAQEITDLPKGWAECGALMKGRFLRGMRPVGDTGGTSNHDHLVAASNIGVGTGLDRQGGTRFLGQADLREHLPPYMNVIFICKQ
ncbi:MAG: hypothetical protein KDJ80_05140 [Nitratireductor sp.]|nr:hypothetical protein [Nitratireductor sp.]